MQFNKTSLIIFLILFITFFESKLTQKSQSDQRIVQSMGETQTLVDKFLFDYKNFKFFLTTFNVNSKILNESILATDWLSVDSHPPDIYVISIQELDLNQMMFGSNSETPREKEWLDVISNNLHPQANYVKIESICLKGTNLMVFVKVELQKYLTDLSTYSVRRGVLGQLGNGGVAIRFNFHQTSLCFIGVHLSPFLEETERRNQDYDAISNEIEFKIDKKFFYLKDHDLVYWLGDLNYRLDALSPDEVKRQLKQGNLSNLLEYDQLKKQQKLGRAFSGYSEAPIKFMPTYKFDLNTDDWDTSAKNRAPAWCDRILWKSDESIANCLEYRNHPKLRFSDHRPVSALFDTKIKIIDPTTNSDAFLGQVQKIIRTADKVQLEISTDKEKVDFNKISFRDIVKDTMVIRNTGNMDAYFDYVNRHSWVKIKPPKGVLISGEQKTLDIEICVDQVSASQMNRRSRQINETITLEVSLTSKHEKNESKQISILLVGEYVPSVFGCSIEALVHLKKPFIQYDEQELINHLKKYEIPANSDSLMVKPTFVFDENLVNTIRNLSKYDIPKELLFLVNQQLKQDSGFLEVFRRSGLRSEFVLLRKAVDMFDSSDLSISQYTIAESILLLLDSFAEPVIPYEFYNRAIESAESFETAKQVINQLPTSHRNVFYYMISFMKENIKNLNFDQRKINWLSLILSKVMLKYPTNEDDSLKRNQFIHQFLVNDF